MGLLKALKPQWWFAAHMHIPFEAHVIHEALRNQGPREDIATSSQPSNPSITNFLALDKCLPKRHFIEVIIHPKSYRLLLLIMLTTGN